MTQHVLLVQVAAPLLVLGRTAYAALWALPPRARRAVALAHRAAPVRTALRAAASPVLGWLAFALVLWGWHAPALYDAALASPAVHALEHLTMLGAAVLFWRVPLAPRAGALAAPYLFLGGAQCTALGALIAFATAPLYAAYASALGGAALEDQQLAGLLMWVPSGVVYLAVIGWRLAGWLEASARGEHGTRGGEVA
jgi:putative membrane protein